jgi:hypothetical protein
MGVHQPSPVGLKIHVSVANIRFSFAKRLYFRAVEHQTRLKSFQKMIVIGSCPVLSNDLLARLLYLGGGFGGCFRHENPS